MWSDFRDTFRRKLEQHWKWDQGVGIDLERVDPIDQFASTWTNLKKSFDDDKWKTFHLTDQSPFDDFVWIRIEKPLMIEKAVVGF